MRTAIKNDLDLPGQLGWVRVCVVTGQDNDISNVLYYSPKDKKTGKSVKFFSLRYVVRYLEETGCRELVSSNFNFARKTLGLGAPGEVWRKALCPAPVIPSDYSLYLQFFIDSAEVDSRRFHSDGTLRKNRNISCTLCPGGRLITATHVTDHMRKVHLPAETCRNCGEEVAAIQAGLHTRECKGGEGRKLHGTGGEEIKPSKIKEYKLKSKELIEEKVNNSSIGQSLLPSKMK